MDTSATIPSDGPLAGFDRLTHSAHGTTRDVYRLGSGPAVVVMAEMPGITPKVEHFARRVADAGFTVWVPNLFGEPGTSGGRRTALAQVARSCVVKDFAAFAQRRTAPVVDWLRDLAARAHEECGGPGVGAVGMCFTGGFALGMALDERMIAPVLSQPSLPIGVTPRAQGDLQLADPDLLRVKERTRDGLCVLGLRFTKDLMVGTRFDTLRRELGDAFIAVEIDNSKGNEWGIPRDAHSVLTEHLVDEAGHPTRDALERVLDFLDDRLRPR